MNKSLFAAAVLFQVFLLALVPLNKISAWLYGTEVLLSTVQIDPYDVLRGYYVTMNYEIQNQVAPKGEVFTLLTVDPKGIARPASVVTEKPEGKLFIAGKNNGFTIDYGIGRYYIPETRTKEINKALVGVRGDTDSVVGIVRLDGDGTPALIGIRIGKNEYRF